MDELRALQRRHHIPLAQLQTYAVHILAEHDDLRITERLLRDVSEENRNAIVNSSQGAASYTPLCRALYAGSIRMTKLLVTAGADVNFRNGHGEGLDEALEAGREAQVTRQPESRIFIEQRFNECSEYIASRRQWLEAEATRTPTAQPWKPRRMRTAAE